MTSPGWSPLDKGRYSIYPLFGNHPSYASPWVGNISAAPGNKMNVCMGYCLPCYIAAVRANVETSHSVVLSPDSRLKHTYQLISIQPLTLRHREPIGRVPYRDYQKVARRNRILVHNGNHGPVPLNRSAH